MGSSRTPSRLCDKSFRGAEEKTAIGQRYVVWVEDLERFAGGGGPKAHETPEDAERLNPIRALLYGLDQLDSVSVITATTSLHVRFDLEKIARFIEEVPALPEDEVASLIVMVRHALRDQHNIIDPAGTKIRQTLDLLSNKMVRESNRAVLGSGVHDLGDALVALCSTARTLKQALRSVFDTWKELAGEVDYDDLLCMSILRTAQPDVFAVVARHVDALSARRSIHAVQGKRDEARQAWERDFDALQLDSKTRVAVEHIVEFVFNETQSELKPQGLFHTQPVDYWARFVSVPPLPESERVQVVLRALRSNDVDAIACLLENGKRAPVVEQFSALETEQLRRLFAILVRKRTHEKASTWPSEDPPGLIPIWRMLLKQVKNGLLTSESIFYDVCAALDTAVPRHLWLAAHIAHYFMSTSQKIGLMDSSHVERAIAHLRELVLASYGNKPSTLVESLVGAPRQTLYWICWGPELPSAKATLAAPFESWPLLVPTILEAARLRPLELLPQIAMLVTSHSTEHDEERGLVERSDFNAAAAANLFSREDEVLDLFEHRDETLWSNQPTVQALFRAVATRNS